MRPDAVIEHLSKPPIDIIPANISLAGADLEMVHFEGGKEELLKKKLDLIRIDMIISSSTVRRRWVCSIPMR